MVVSKRCKICTVLDTDNVPISGEYFGKLLPKLIERICGTELDERKINGVLICVHCALELVLTDVIIDKLRNSVQRLRKYVKETKPKTPSKEPIKKIGDNDSPIKNAKKNVINGTPSDEISTKVNGENKLQKVSDDIKPLDETFLSKNPKKLVKRKSEFPDNKNVETLEVNTGIPKFKKISDNKDMSIKHTPTKDKKRKPESIDDSVSLDSIDNNDFKPKKPKNSLSVENQSSMDFTIDEQDFDATNMKQPKVINCVICGKSFNKKTILREHFDACHMGERLKECPHCSIEFRSQQKYDSHVFGEKCKNTLHPCQYPKCNKHFKTIHKMELHMQEKHSSQNESETD